MCARINVDFLPPQALSREPVMEICRRAIWKHSLADRNMDSTPPSLIFVQARPIQWMSGLSSPRDTTLRNRKDGRYSCHDRK